MANVLWALLCIKRSFFFWLAAGHVAAIQKNVLSRIIYNNTQTVFGHSHHFFSIKNIPQYQSRVTLSVYEDYIPYIDLIIQGEQNVLTAEPVLILEPSSGSTSSSKYIPYTKGLREDFRNGLAPWIFNLLNNRRRLLLGSAFWSISPNTLVKKKDSKVPIGFGDDTGYFGSAERWLLGHILAVPGLVSHIDNMDTYRYVTLLFLLRDKYLAFISVWNPTFLTLLLEPLRSWFPQLIQDIRAGTMTTPGILDVELKKQLLKSCGPDQKRADELAGLYSSWTDRGFSSQSKKFLSKDIWPRLSLISCWADSHASTRIQELKEWFPNVEIQPKGLLATEGMISFPLMGKKGSALSLRSHFFEFIELEDDKENGGVDIKLAHQLEDGKSYSVVITTRGGLYRYKLSDIIRVVGFEKQCPLVQFIGKEDKISDLTGEKLNELHVAKILTDAFKQYSLEPTFFLLAPEKDNNNGTYAYTLFLELNKNGVTLQKTFSLLIKEVEQRLEDNYHYAHCIRLKQLLPARLFLIQENNQSAQIYLDTCQKNGQKIGQIKPAVLSSQAGWSEHFRGDFL